MTARALTTRHLVLRARVGAIAVRFICLTLTCCVLALGLVSHSGSPFARYSSPKLLAAVMFGVRRLDPPFAEGNVSIKSMQFSSQRVRSAGVIRAPSGESLRVGSWPRHASALSPAPR